MALRVLLADESSTIKKAIQMALADYGVEVKSVPSGLDVLPVTHTFQPDIILADILLTKKNGYEVCFEIKSDAKTRSIPVILMWSSFMQLDQPQAQKVKADGSIEKPFDSETLRQIIEKCVPKLKQFPLKGLLNHPELPDFVESETFIRQKSDFESKNNPSTQSQTHTLSSAPAEEEEEFQKVDLKPNKTQQPDDWSASASNQFVMETESHGDFEEVVSINSAKNESPNLQQRISEQVQSYLDDSPIAQIRTQQKNSYDEQLVKADIKQIAERICWQVIPEITEKIVREELNKLLHNIENDHT